MTVLANSAGLWGQLSNLTFFLCAVFSDILPIRVCLTLGYLFLLISALTGFPDFKQIFFNDSLGDAGPLYFVDTAVWCCLTLPFHAYAVFRCLQDEMKITFDEDTEKVWRFFYRRSGMGRLELRRVIKNASWVTVKKGETIIDGNRNLQYFFLIVEGVIEFSSKYQGITSTPRQLRSGDFFDMKLGNLFGVNLGFNHDVFHACASTDCTLLMWSFDDMNAMATQEAPAISSYWRSMILFSVSHELNRLHEGMTLVGAEDTQNIAEDPSWMQGGISRDFTRPIQAEEQLKAPGILPFLWRSFGPFPPKGLRHHTLPISGIQARTRIAALSKAQIARKNQIMVEARNATFVDN
eukprot:m.9720 g.9720  ORF g.9720 m.9720 type:complete len:351 (+) comp3529_c0_seq1:152-1204(+)